VLDAMTAPLSHGAHVVVHAKPEFWVARGSLSLAADEVRPVGVGELLARLERLKQVLAAEGVFAADRKRALPFLPRTVGLVCGRASAAEKDVVENARRRWPAVQFRICEVAVQGPHAVTEVTAAIERLDRDSEVDVIVVTRGGGSIEDLLPFSNETLVRAVAGCRTPVVSAIGHEVDTPLLDLVADVRPRRRPTPPSASSLTSVKSSRASSSCVGAPPVRFTSTSSASARGLPPCAHGPPSPTRCAPWKTGSVTCRRGASASAAACGNASTGRATTSPTPVRACTRCRLRRRSTVATPSCSGPTAPSYGRPTMSRPATTYACAGQPGTPRRGSRDR
jgi:hypothetical protein